MPKLPSLTPRKLIKALEKGDFVFARQKGSHRAYTKGNLIVIIPFHNNDLKTGTLRSIIEQAGYTPEQFIELL